MHFHVRTGISAQKEQYYSLATGTGAGLLSTMEIGFVCSFHLPFCWAAEPICSYRGDRAGLVSGRKRGTQPPRACLVSKQLWMRQDDDTPSYLRVPIPAYGYLGISSVLAIASIGCVFELSSGKPQYGSALTTVILLLSLPSFLATFWLALQKGRHESEQ
jgi:hypothetical protein